MTPATTDPPVLDSGERGKQLRWTLLGVFAAMLALMTIAGIDSLRSLRKLHQVSREVTQQYSERSRALQTIVISFHVYDEDMEQFLLSDIIVTTVPGSTQIADHRKELHTALHTYPVDSDGQERRLMAQIEQAITAEETAFAEAPSWHSNDRARVFIARELIPTRAQVLSLASAVSQANEKKLLAENELLTNQFQSLQSRVSRLVILTLVAGILLSLAAGYYILRLEESGRRRYLALAHSREELEALSKRMVELQEAERLAISRELHDEVGQTLGALLVDVGQLSGVLPREDSLVREQIARIKNAAESAVRSIRDMALLLRPPMLDDLGLLPALEWQARETSRRGEMEVEVHANDLPDNLPDTTKVGIYRLVQEALQNAARHAHAKSANVSVKYENGKVEVEISDNGVGFDPRRTRGMGILGMEERVRQLGGTLELRSAPGKGTTVYVVLPLEGKDQK